MKKNMKRFAAMGLAATMLLGSSVVALADDVTTNVTTGDEKIITGTGVESYVQKNVMKVTLPTLANAFDYKVDPQGLVAEVMKYDGAVAEAVTDNTGVVFKNTDSNNRVTVSNYSNPVTIINKSSIPVEIGVSAQLAAAAQDPLALTELATSADFTTDANSSKALYLGLIPTNDRERALGSNPVIANNILLSAADQYEVANASGTTYTYAPKNDAVYPEFSFYLTGAINRNVANSTWATDDGAGNLTAKNPPSVTVKFTLTKVADAHEAGVGFVDDDLYIWNPDAADLTKDGGMGGANGTTAPTTVKINGEAVTGATATLGYVVVPFDKIADRFDYTASEISNLTVEQRTVIKNYVKAVTVTTAAPALTFYGEL